MKYSIHPKKYNAYLIQTNGSSIKIKTIYFVKKIKLNVKKKSN